MAANNSRRKRVCVWPIHGDAVMTAVESGIWDTLLSHQAREDALCKSQTDCGVQVRTYRCDCCLYDHG